MPSIVFMSGDSSKEVSLNDVNSVEDVASNMKEVIEADKNNTYLESEDSEGNSISVDVSKTLESNKGLLEHPFYNWFN